MQAFLVHQAAFTLHWWNLTVQVGLASPNNPDDVQLVQFGFFCMGPPTSRISDPQNRIVYARVVPGSPFTPGPNEPLSLAISTLEFGHGVTQRDRRINPFPPTGYTYQDRSGRHPFMIGYLLNSMYDSVGPDNWPRLDRHPNCPPLVAAAVRNASTLR